MARIPLKDELDAKLEWFAAMAMQGLLTRMPLRHGGESDLGIVESERIAQESIIMAKKMMNALYEKDLFK